MARRQLYDDVLDVALRATLEEHGFTRKTRRDYVREQPDRVWIFEVEMAPDPRPGFEAWAAVSLPRLDEIIKKLAPGLFGHHAPTHNPSNVQASLADLIEIGTGFDVRQRLRWVHPQEARAERKRLSAHLPAMKYLSRDGWVLPDDVYEFELGDEEYIRRWTEGSRELGLFLDKQWRAFAWDWYQKCDDPMFVADWIEDRERGSDREDDCACAVLCHMAGDNQRAATYLRRRFEAAAIPYDDVYNELHRRHRGPWYRGLWEGSSRWSPEQVADHAHRTLLGHKIGAEAARQLADGLGIKID